MPKKRHVKSASSLSRVSDQQHVNAIHKLLNDPRGIDVARLRALAPRGFVNNGFRRRIWPLLLGVNERKVNQRYPAVIHIFHRYYDQVNKDVVRSLFHFDVHKHGDLKMREADRKVLAKVIHALFCTHQGLHYVQGFHDVCSVFLVVCGVGLDALAFAMIEKLALLHVRDSLRPTLDTTLSLLSTIFPLLNKMDPVMHAFLEEANAQSFLTLSWVLTWFSHNIDTFESVARIFDFLLASHPAMIIYLCASFLRAQRGHVLKLQPDMGEVHMYFQSAPKAMNLDAIIAGAQEMYHAYPYTSLFRDTGVNVPKDSPLRATDLTELFQTSKVAASLSLRKSVSPEELQAEAEEVKRRRSSIQDYGGFVKMNQNSTLKDYIADEIDSETGKFCGKLEGVTEEEDVDEERSSFLSSSSSSAHRASASSGPTGKAAGRSVPVLILIALLPIVASVSWLLYSSSYEHAIG